jgi:hypothetical protein
MQHYPKPFPRTQPGLWYVRFDGRQVTSAPTETRGSAAVTTWWREVATDRNRRPTTPWFGSSTCSPTSARSIGPHGPSTGTATTFGPSPIRSRGTSPSRT